MPAELLWLPGRALAEETVDQGRPLEVHRFLERALQVLRVLDIEALAAKRVHHAVMAGAQMSVLGFMLNIEFSANSDRLKVRMQARLPESSPPYPSGVIAIVT